MRIVNLLKFLPVVLCVLTFVTPQGMASKKDSVNLNDFLPRQELTKEDKKLIQELLHDQVAIEKEVQHQLKDPAGRPSSNFDKLTPAQQIGIRELVSLLKDDKNPLTQDIKNNRRFK